MGQRLNIEIVNSKEKGDVLANCYYHWSGYTSSSLLLVGIVFDVLKPMVKEYGITKKMAINVLEETGATLTSEELDEVNKLYPGEFSLEDVTVNRNNGLINITSEGINETRRWEEARVTVYAEDDKISFDALWYCEEEELDEDLNEDEIKRIPELDFELDNMTYDEFIEFQRIVSSAIDDGIYYCKTNGDYYGFIE